MTIASDPANVSTEWPELRQQRRVIVVVDVVESVRLMQANEADVIDRWRRFVNEVRTQVLPKHRGRLVKSLGDGLLLEFAGVTEAVACAFDIQHRVGIYNAGRAADMAILLRIGVHVASIYIDQLDVYGAGVNLAARIASLAGPGEIAVSADVRDLLVPELDADVEDLGNCFIKHLQDPVHAYRLGPAAPATTLEGMDQRTFGELRPSIAVLPFECTSSNDPADHLGEALADDVVSELARSPDLHVISGLSSRALKRRRLSAEEVGARLSCGYILSGRYRLVDARVWLSVELADVRACRVIWADRFESLASDLFDFEMQLAGRIVQEVTRAILIKELELASTQPLPTLESYTLLLGAIALMHRASPAEFERARQMLEHLAYRHGRSGIAHAWLAKWHVLRVVQGWAPDPSAEGAHALHRVQRALDASPRNALALSIGGLVHGYLRKDLAAAGRMYDNALASNPNEPLAWLFSATRHAYLGEGVQAEEASALALRLSPLDPLRYFFDSLAATAVLANQNWERSVQLARRSIKANRTHASTWRTLAYGLVMLDRPTEARHAVQELLAIEPNLTVRRFRARFPGRDGPMAEPWAHALASAGLPD